MTGFLCGLIGKERDDLAGSIAPGGGVPGKDSSPEVKLDTFRIIGSALGILELKTEIDESSVASSVRSLIVFQGGGEVARKL